MTKNKDRKREERECKLHGMTNHAEYINGGYSRQKCIECAAEVALKYRRDKIKQSFEYLGGKCKDCGYDKSEYLRVFSYVNKKTNLKFHFPFNTQSLKWENLKLALDNYEIVCKNCEELRFAHAAKASNEKYKREFVIIDDECMGQTDSTN